MVQLFIGNKQFHFFYRLLLGKNTTNMPEISLEIKFVITNLKILLYNFEIAHFYAFQYLLLQFQKCIRNNFIYAITYFPLNVRNLIIVFVKTHFSLQTVK